MTDETLSIRFFRGKSEIGKSTIIENLTILDLAENAGVEIPRNCTSGTCGQGYRQAGLVELFRFQTRYPPVLMST